MFQELYKMRREQLEKQNVTDLVEHIIELKHKITRMKWDGIDCACGEEHRNPYDFIDNCNICNRPLCSNKNNCKACCKSHICQDCLHKCTRCSAYMCTYCIEQRFPYQSLEDW